MALGLHEQPLASRGFHKFDLPEKLETSDVQHFPTFNQSGMETHVRGTSRTLARGSMDTRFHQSSETNSE
jgi:hypothetical protein